MIRRWLTLSIYAVIGAITVYTFNPLFSRVAELAGGRLAPLPFLVAQFISACAIVVVVTALAPMHTCRLRHLFTLAFPTWIWAAVVGSVLTALLLLTANEWKLPSSFAGMSPLLAPVVLGVAGGMFINHWIDWSGRNQGPTPHVEDMADGRSTGQPSGKLSDDPGRLDQWISEPEAPINALIGDRFDHAMTARRIARHIKDSASTRSIGLVGPYGSGKTSVLYAVETLLRREKNRRFLVTWVRSWGASSGIAAAELILRAALAELARYVDGLSLADVPATYRSALEKSGSSILSAISALASGDAQAESTLQRVDRVLKACNFQLVIFLEDLDRNDIQAARFGEVQSLLDRLKQSTESISFILAIGEEARKHIDFAKLCDRYEVLTEVSEAEASKLIKAFTINRLRGYPTDITWYVNKDGRAIKPGAFDDVVIPRQLVALLTTPRVLRTTLRIVLRAWPALHGEIDLFEFLTVTALRSAVPAAFQFLIANVEELRGHTFRDAKKHAEWLKERWDVAVAELPPHLAGAAQEALDYLFPGWQTGIIQGQRTPQSIRRGPHAGHQFIIQDEPVDYWQRIFAEEVDGLHDQEVAREIVLWKTERSSASLFTRLTASDAFGERFEALVRASRDPDSPLHLDPEALYFLADQFHRHLLDTGGAAACIEHQTVPEGFFSIWRLLLVDRQLGEPHLEWVLSQIDRSLRISLRLALDVEYWWADAKTHPEWGEKARRHLVQGVRHAIEESSTDWLGKVLDPSSIAALHRLIRHANGSPTREVKDWRWILPTLRNLALADARFAPQIMYLLSQSVDNIDRTKIGIPEHTQRLILDLKYLADLIPDVTEQIAFLNPLIKAYDFQGLDAKSQSSLRDLQQGIVKYSENIKTGG